MEKPIYGINSCSQLNNSDLEISIKIVNDLLLNLDKNKNKKTALDRINNVKNLIDIQKTKK
ncbi:MAG: hypothetical protein EBT86_03975 [Actinobacteria bacterium]|nr:hypothetical protein [Actinomycetota bacterium]